MNKWKESELVRSLVGFFLLFLLFIGLFIFVVPSTHQSSKIAEKIKSIKEDLSNRISKIESILNDIQISNSGDIVLHSLPNEKKYNRKLFIAYAIGAAGLIVSLCSLVL